MLQLITGPTADPISLAEAKAHLRVTFPDDDTLITLLVRASKDYAENFTRKQFVAARWKQVLDAFPQASQLGGPFDSVYARPRNAIYLERGPVTQVVSVNYLDMQGMQQVMPAANYVVDYASDPVRITPVFGQIWPISMPQIGSVWVVFDTGFAAPITASGNNVTVQGWSALTVGNAVRFSNSGGALPAPLAEQTDYFIQSVVSPGVYTLSATSGGALLPLTTAGTGTNFIGVIPDGLKSWLKLRIGALYENREELTEASMQVSLPFVDMILESFRTFEF